VRVHNTVRTGRCWRVAEFDVPFDVWVRIKLARIMARPS
jgi:hypothetical protein